MTRARLELGTSGEELAARWYTAHGYQVLARNWRCRDGELDLVARPRRPGRVLRGEDPAVPAFGLPAEAVTPAKQRRLRRLALRWLAERQPGERFPDLRFDVACVVARPGATPTLEIIEAAF